MKVKITFFDAPSDCSLTHEAVCEATWVYGDFLTVQYDEYNLESFPVKNIFSVHEDKYEEQITLDELLRR